jgi:hypothetical protein
MKDHQAEEIWAQKNIPDVRQEIQKNLLNNQIDHVLDILRIFEKMSNKITELDLRRVLVEHLGGINEFQQ